ncbi:hypothetical protein MA16_Dca005285 [Dendrobium catenatum]|uniref:Uncharacterized protein n=1 Tax=Dendrobium catenatum TaxID=906689 RepID=A0A2I0VLS2_9ASPA|nr:hypothetical protein MA16_Dca005285 [Dendrobium catenatum]
MLHRPACTIRGIGKVGGGIEIREGAKSLVQLEVSIGKGKQIVEDQNSEVFNASMNKKDVLEHNQTLFKEAVVVPEFQMDQKVMDNVNIIHKDVCDNEGERKSEISKIYFRGFIVRDDDGEQSPATYGRCSVKEEMSFGTSNEWRISECYVFSPAFGDDRVNLYHGVKVLVKMNKPLIINEGGQEMRKKMPEIVGKGKGILLQGNLEEVLKLGKPKLIKGDKTFSPYSNFKSTTNYGSDAVNLVYDCGDKGDSYVRMGTESNVAENSGRNLLVAAEDNVLADMEMQFKFYFRLKPQKSLLFNVLVYINRNTLFFPFHNRINPFRLPYPFSDNQIRR